MSAPPLIATLALNEEVAGFFNRLREQHFPPDRNFIDAHLTLFHALPNDHEIINTIKEVCAGRAPFKIEIVGPVSIGKGVAFKGESTDLQSLHSILQKRLKDVLTPQDKQKLWPHITIQNKVSPTEAKILLERLKPSFLPVQSIASGLQLWEYLGGPWKFVASYPFNSSLI